MKRRCRVRLAPIDPAELERMGRCPYCAEIYTGRDHDRVCREHPDPAAQAEAEGWIPGEPNPWRDD